MNDQQFIQALRNFLIAKQGIATPIVPRIWSAAGTLNRAATLALPCYAGFSLDEHTGGAQ